jgi:hypothetical protein
MDNGVIALVSLAVALVLYKVVNSDSVPSKPVTHDNNYDEDEYDDEYDRRGGTRRKRSKRKTKHR